MALFGSSASARLEKQIFNLKFTAKQLNKLASKAEKEERAELLKVKNAMERGEMDTARIYGQNAIRIRNTGNGYLKLGSRVDAVASRLESAAKMQQMGTVVKGMDHALASMDMGAIGQLMEQFESSFEQVDMRAEAVEGALNVATASTMPADEVDALIAQVSDEHGLEFKARAVDAASGAVAQQVPVGQAEEEKEDALEARLAALRAV